MECSPPGSPAKVKGKDFRHPPAGLGFSTQTQTKPAQSTKTPAVFFN
jgi:hypothetical protein